MILATCTVEDLTPELLSGKVKSGDEKVVLNIECSDDKTELGRAVLSLKNNSVMCVTVTKVIQGYSELPVVTEEDAGTVFLKFDRSEYDSIRDSIEDIISKGYTPLCVYEDDFCDMRDVYDLCMNKIRVIGGNFLEIPGTLIGRYMITLLK